MLLDEGCFGTFHFGFGSNILLGGQNRTNFHLDFVIQAHRLLVDEKDNYGRIVANGNVVQKVIEKMEQNISNFMDLVLI